MIVASGNLTLPHDVRKPCHDHRYTVQQGLSGRRPHRHVELDAPEGQLLILAGGADVECIDHLVGVAHARIQHVDLRPLPGGQEAGDYKEGSGVLLEHTAPEAHERLPSVGFPAAPQSLASGACVQQLPLDFSPVPVRHAQPQWLRSSL